MSTVSMWRKPTVYIGRPTVQRLSHQVFHVIGAPYPIHRAEVHQDTPGGPWEVIWHTGALAIGERFPTAQAALVTTVKVIGEVTARDWRERFDGGQRTMMGQQKCPYSYATDVYCGRSIEVGTVWCRRHPWGKVLT